MIQRQKGFCCLCLCFYSLATKKGSCLHTSSIILLPWLCSRDRTVFGQLPRLASPSCLLCAAAAGLLLYKCTATAAPWMVEEDRVGGSGAGVCYIITHGWKSSSCQYLWVTYHFKCWDFLFYLTHMVYSCWCFYHISRPKSTQISLQFSIILSSPVLTYLLTQYNVEYNKRSFAFPRDQSCCLYVMHVLFLLLRSDIQAH